MALSSGRWLLHVWLSCVFLSSTGYVISATEGTGGTFFEDPFGEGSFPVRHFVIPASKLQGPPKSLHVFAPQVPPQGSSAAASAPVVIFQHGFNLMPDFYSQMLSNVSSHGYLVVAPQMYSLCVTSDAMGEIIDATSIVLWLQKNLASALIYPDTVPPDFDNLALGGHSRGGKVAYGVALGLGGTEFGEKALILLDPVDGSSGSQTNPPILDYRDDSLRPGSATLVVGTGLGPIPTVPYVGPSCAPLKMGHEYFYNDTVGPVYHLTATEYGHMDVLDDRTDGALGLATYVACKNGKSRGPMRKLSGGLVVSFLKMVFGTDPNGFTQLLQQPENLPVDVTEVAWRAEVGHTLFKMGEIDSEVDLAA